MSLVSISAAPPAPHADVRLVAAEALREELTAVVVQAASDLAQAQALRAALAERTS